MVLDAHEASVSLQAMKITPTAIPEVKIIESPVFGDHRGFFMESWNAEKWAELGLDMAFVQDNVSKSAAGVLRGLHFQHPPKAQGKLVRVLQGAVYDVAVDLRKDSPSYGQHVGIELNDENHLALWVPPGFAHGFATLKDDTIFAYKCTQNYAPELEDGIRWDDAALNIQWPIDNPQLSEKDKVAQEFKAFKSPF